MVDDDGRKDGRRRRTPDHGHPISSPCEPNGSGELIKKQTNVFFLQEEYSSTLNQGLYRDPAYMPKHNICQDTGSFSTHMMVGPIFVVLIIHRQPQDDRNRSGLK